MIKRSPFPKPIKWFGHCAVVVVVVVVFIKKELFQG